jgi:hypothetical protein
LAVPDVVLHLSVAHFPASFQALAPDSPSALAERARQDVLQARQVPPPLDAQKKVAFPVNPPDAVHPPRLVVDHRAQP